MSLAERDDAVNVGQALRAFYDTYYTRPQGNRFEPLHQKGSAALPELCSVLDTSDDSDERTDALRSIGIIFADYGVDAETLDQLITLGTSLKGEFSEERHALLYAVGAARDEDFCLQLAHAFATRQEEPMRVAAIVWGHARYRRSAEALCSALSSAPPGAIPDIVWALGRIGGETAETHCLALLEHERFAGYAVGALSDMGSRAAIWPLIERLEEPVPETRLLVTHALCVLARCFRGDRAAKRALRGGLDALQRLVEDPFRPIAIHALECVALLGGHVDEDVARHALGMPRRARRVSRQARFALRHGMRCEDGLPTGA
jgi:hypothetical protein